MKRLPCSTWNSSPKIGNSISDVSRGTSFNFYLQIFVSRGTNNLDFKITTRTIHKG